MAGIRGAAVYPHRAAVAMASPLRLQGAAAMKPTPQQVDVRLRAEPGCPDFIRMLKLALKFLLRRFRLRAVSVTPVKTRRKK